MSILYHSLLLVAILKGMVTAPGTNEMPTADAGNEVEGGPEDVSADLRLLNERADILCKELKQLNIENTPVTSNDEDIDLVNEDTEDFKEIMRQYSDFIIIIPEEDQKTEAASDDSPLLPEEDIEIIPETACNPEDTPSTGKTQILVEPIEEKASESNVPEIKEYKKVEVVVDEVDDGHKSPSLLENDIEISPKIASNSQDNTTSIVPPNKVENEISNNSAVENVPENIDPEIIEPQEEESKNDDELEKQVVEENDDKIDNESLEREQIEESFDDLSFQQALDKLKNFKPKRPVQPSPQFPDLSVEGETMARVKSHGSCHYWRMPFRHDLFAEEMRNKDPEAENIVSWYLRGHPNDDAHRFTPSGDIYSYFQRRPPYPIKFTYPLVNNMKMALGGPSRKLALRKRE